MTVPVGLASETPGLMWPAIVLSGTIMGMAFFRSRTLLVTVGIITIVALSTSMAVMFI